MIKTFATGRGGDSSSLSNKASYNTVRPTPYSPLGGRFRMKVMFFFALVAVLTALVMIAVLGYVWAEQFRGYTRENLQRLAQATADTLSAEYQQEGAWTDEVVEYARSASSASPDVGVQVLDRRGRVVYDDTWSAYSRQIITSAETDAALVGSSVPVSVTPDDINASVMAEVVDKNGVRVGQVRLWAFGTEALVTKADAAFRNRSYKAIGISAVVAVLLAFVMGSFASRSLTRPIKIITSTAAQIRGGDLTARTGLTGDDEIGRLGETFDSMATSLERDIKFEHRLTSDVAHELRTPLMAMLVTVEAMQDGVLPADNEHFETVASEVRRLSRLVDAMLHLSRIENGKRELKIEHTDVVCMVRSLVSVQHQLFHERGLHLRFDDKTSRHECYADIDPDLIREAITNLMSNAMRYTPLGGWIVVWVDSDRKDAIVGVTDTGIGIAEEDIPKVFSRFWRSDVSRERAAGGLGVGLAITKEIIDQHNGKITIESELGKGTTFALHIPLVRKEAKEQG